MVVLFAEENFVNVLWDFSETVHGRRACCDRKNLIKTLIFVTSPGIFVKRFACPIERGAVGKVSVTFVKRFASCEGGGLKSRVSDRASDR
jgi:hypothetical protein